jgi:Na+-driven multidrug efflux pump
MSDYLKFSSFKVEKSFILNKKNPHIVYKFEFNLSPNVIPSLVIINVPFLFLLLSQLFLYICYNHPLSSSSTVYVALMHETFLKTSYHCDIFSKE